jgi:hypothetical protein
MEVEREERKKEDNEEEEEKGGVCRRGDGRGVGVERSVKKRRSGRRKRMNICRRKRWRKEEHVEEEK